jgi:hypothetical protein
MTKQFTLKCQAGKQDIDINFFVGNPNENSHPIGYQMKFFSQKGIIIPEEIVQALGKLNEIAKQNRIPVEDLIGYVSEELKFGDTIKEQILNNNKS